jgi:hypothetical protein
MSGKRAPPNTPSRLRIRIQDRRPTDWLGARDSLTTSAVARLMPCPPARVEIRYTGMRLPSALNVRTSISRLMRFVEPSSRRNPRPSGPKRTAQYSLSTSSVSVYCENSSTREPCARTRKSSRSRRCSFPDARMRPPPCRRRSSSSMACAAAVGGASTAGVAMYCEPSARFCSRRAACLSRSSVSRMHFGWLITFCSCSILACSCCRETSPSVRASFSRKRWYLHRVDTATQVHADREKDISKRREFSVTSNDFRSGCPRVDTATQVHADRENDISKRREFSVTSNDFRSGC